jgi:hypothetical protein
MTWRDGAPRRGLMSPRQRWVRILVLVAPLACRDAPEDSEGSGDPLLLTRDLPFVYPPALYAARVEGDVALRLFVDSLGLVVQESTSVAERSGRAGSMALLASSFKARGRSVGRTVVREIELPPADSALDTYRKR